MWRHPHVLSYTMTATSPSQHIAASFWNELQVAPWSHPCGLLSLRAVRVVDNTLTIIIASAVGGAIALLMGFMLIKNLTLFVLAKLEEKKWVFPTPIYHQHKHFIRFHQSILLLLGSKFESLRYCNAETVFKIFKLEMFVCAVRCLQF